MIRMALVEKSVLIEYPAPQMYALVDDIASYPAFLPWCGGTQILTRNEERVQATIRIDYHGIRQSFSTENRLRPDESIEMKLLNGPFRELDGIWRFKALGDAACKVEFRLKYEFSSKLLEKLVGPVFQMIANTFVESFVRRAEQLYGRR
jgi:ribosome-associated toxin RatA of RatAB toxin-antitoxin module